jgi:hypothetical protein
MTTRRHSVIIARIPDTESDAGEAAGHTSPVDHPHAQALRADVTATTLARQPRKQRPLRRDELARVIEQIDTSTSAGLRDRALLLTGHALELRRPSS